MSFERKDGEAKLREQKIEESGWICESMVETEGNKKEQSIADPESAWKVGEESLLKKIM